MILRSRRLVGGILAGAALALPFVGPAEASGSSCEEVRLPVAVSPDAEKTETIAGTLCTPKDWADGERQIDVLVHGGTYNQMYWHWPQDTERYSYVLRANADGRATFAFDRLGVGESSRPASTMVNQTADAYALHQVVQWARQDHDAVNVVTHSIGALVGIEEAGTYNDVDRLVVTGMLHGVGWGNRSITTLASFYPAILDPKFADDGLDPLWLTTLPGTRGSSFYNAETADPKVIAYDEAHKDLYAGTGHLTAALSKTLPSLLNNSSNVKVPVLLMVGEQDALWCNLLLDCGNQKAVYANERPFFGQAESLTVETVPDTGHNLMLHPSAGDTYDTIADWLATH